MYNKAVLILVMASLLQITSTTVYYVIPDNFSQVINNASTLQHYIDNDHEYFKSHTQLYFLPGQHYLQSNFILQNVINFTISGNKSAVICNSSSLGITISNVQSIMIINIEFKQCGKVYNVQVELSKYGMDNMPFHWRGALYLNHSSAIVIHNVSVAISDGVSGVIVINSKGKFKTTNLQVLATCEQLNSVTSGMLFYYDNMTAGVNYEATDIRYKTNGLCNRSFVFVLLMTQEDYGITFNVYNTSFNHLNNSGIMYYHGGSCGIHNNNVVIFENCEINYNYGNSYLNLFHISIHSEDYTFLYIKGNYGKQCDRQNIITFRNCCFDNNSNINSLLYVNLTNCLTLNTIINITDSHILYNENVSFITSDSQLKVFWQPPLNIIVMSTNISFNKHKGLASLMSLTNTAIKFMDKVTINENRYFRMAIIQLQFSFAKFINYIEFSNNHARHVLYGKVESFYLLEEGATVNITNNIVFIVVQNTLSYDDNLNEMCWFQFVSTQGCLDKDTENSNFKVLIINNTYTAPQHQLMLRSRNCNWLTGTVFQTINFTTVYGKFFQLEGTTIASKEQMKTIPLRLCPCVNTKSYDCTKRKLGEIFLGQTLKTRLMMDTSIPSRSPNVTINIRDYRLQHNTCIITDALEMVQRGLSHTCTEYNYTIWYAGNDTKCELYLRTDDMPETFFVTVKPCPIGFSLHSRNRACDCDTLLNTNTLSITSCNLDEGTVLRPANSWLSASTVNGSHTYLVAPSCPFDYCLPYSSYLSFGNPDSQCQFGRSGELCGKCMKGLSTVFGSSNCKKCSNMFIILIIPIAIAGFALVAMLFIFNLTVTNGKINTIIFYANIININHLVFFPKHNSPLYIFLSFLNLDLGIETCFYVGMNDYVKTWLQLLFPIYLLMIAGLIIITSRYSVRVQRITARKVLPVLATLFLLSYTKIIRTIGSVFRYSKITQLPSKTTTLAWSVSTNIPLFGVQFTILFTVCLILLLILLPFNAILVFSRKLTYFKFINRLKPLLDAYHAPYKDEVPYWVGLQLVIRKLVLALSVFVDKDVNFLSVSILFGILFCIHGVVNPFNSKFLNIQETLILLNLLAIHVTAFYDSRDGKETNDTLEIIEYLILTAAIYFVIVFFYQCLMMVVVYKENSKLSKVILNFKKSLLTSKVFKRLCANNHKPKVTLELRTTIPDLSFNYQDFQEPLLALSS